MKALTYSKYGLSDVLALKMVEQPIPKDKEVLVKVHAVSLNASDWEFLTGKPAYVKMWGLFKPKHPILGSDIAGEIVAIGKSVTHFKIGDKVMGDIMYAWGGLAEYVCVKENSLVIKPPTMTYEDAAALPQAGVVALQALRDKGQIQAGQKVLINGAGGGAGTFAIQIAKNYGAEVTGIDHTDKLEFMRSVGADKVIDYTQEDFVKKGQIYDLIIDFVAYRSLFDHKQVLNKNGQYILVGGALSRLLKVLTLGSIISIFGKQKLGILAHEQSRKDLKTVIEWCQTGKLVPMIDKVFSLEEVAQAFAYLGAGKAKGKIVIKIV